MTDVGNLDPEAVLRVAGAQEETFTPRQPQTMSPIPSGIVEPESWTSAPKPREWIVESWIPRGVVTALYGDGGVGKSLLMQLFMTCVAMGKPFLGMSVAAGQCLGVFCEDELDELRRRQWDINAHLDIKQGSVRNLWLWPRVGDNSILMNFPSSGEPGKLTEFFHELERACEQIRPDVIVFDTIADGFGGNEVDRRQVRQFVQETGGRLARRFNAAFVFCGHPSQAGISTGSGFSGSTAWNNTVRSRLYLKGPPSKDAEAADPDARTLSRMKANYAPRSAEIALQWFDGCFKLAAGTGRRSALQWPEIETIFNEIDRAWNDNKALSPHPQTKLSGRYLPARILAKLGIAEEVTAKALKDWLASEHLAYLDVDTSTKKKGLKVVKRMTPEG